MSRRAKTVAILGFEACLIVAMCASLAYFVRDSRDFIAQRPESAPSASIPSSR